MDLESKLGLMEQDMKGHGRMIQRMDLENFFIRMVIYMKVRKEKKDLKS